MLALLIDYRVLKNYTEMIVLTSETIVYKKITNSEFGLNKKKWLTFEQ